MSNDPFAWLAAICSVAAIIFAGISTHRAGLAAEQKADQRANIAEENANARAIEAEKRARAAEKTLAEQTQMILDQQLKSEERTRAASLGEPAACYFGDVRILNDDTTGHKYAELRLGGSRENPIREVVVKIRDLNQIYSSFDETTYDEKRLKAVMQYTEVIEVGTLAGGRPATVVKKIVLPRGTDSFNLDICIEALTGVWYQRLRGMFLGGNWESCIDVRGTFIDGVRLVARSEGFPVDKKLLRPNLERPVPLIGEPTGSTGPAFPY